MDYKMVKEVHRRVKASTKALKLAMAVLAVLFLLAGIALDRGMMLLAFLMAGMYFLFEFYAVKYYEYVMEGDRFTVTVIHAKRRRKEVHELDLKDLEAVAPHWHGTVAKYRVKGGTQRLPKYDYTSYEPDIPYYTMVILENQKKIKLLLDLPEEMLRAMKQRNPQKVFMQDYGK